MSSLLPPIPDWPYAWTVVDLHPADSGAGVEMRTPTAVVRISLEDLRIAAADPKPFLEVHGRPVAAWGVEPYVVDVWAQHYRAAVEAILTEAAAQEPASVLALNPDNDRDVYITASMLTAGKASVFSLELGRRVDAIHLRRYVVDCALCGRGERRFHLDPRERPFLVIRDWVS